MCREGKIREAYELAKSNLSSDPTNVWSQRSLGWALYYLMKDDARHGDYDTMIAHLTELKSLDQLSVDNDRMIFDNVQFPIASFIKNHLSPENEADTGTKLDGFFSIIKDYRLGPSGNHSYLLREILKFSNWSGTIDFIDWWNLDNFTKEDFEQMEFHQVNETISPDERNSQRVTSSKNRGPHRASRKAMSLVERTYIAYSKALLKTLDKTKTEKFLPRLDALTRDHEEMTYPGYFYGKLLLAIGRDEEDTLKILIPFARKKAKEFWVWQLLSEVFTNDDNKRLACLLRALRCGAQETFVGKVRISLADLYIKRGQYDLARFQIDTVICNYTQQGWHLPSKLSSWTRQPWYENATPKDKDTTDYKTFTNELLYTGAEECVAVVSRIEPLSHRCSLIYGYKKNMSTKLGGKVYAGDVLKLHYTKDQISPNPSRDASGNLSNPVERIRIIQSENTSLPTELDYAKIVDGTIIKRDDRNFAFLKSDSISSFIPPALVNKYGLHDGDKVKSIIVYDYNKKKETWNWICVTMGL